MKLHERINILKTIKYVGKSGIATEPAWGFYRGVPQKGTVVDIDMFENVVIEWEGQTDSGHNSILGCGHPKENNLLKYEEKPGKTYNHLTAEYLKYERKTKK